MYISTLFLLVGWQHVSRNISKRANHTGTPVLTKNSLASSNHIDHISIRGIERRKNETKNETPGGPNETKRGSNPRKGPGSKPQQAKPIIRGILPGGLGC